ncbi:MULTISPECIES: hypothetical protein [unclassified Frankia]|uniref:hypothetical protein n=1 Tax=unclassified Frankia TaxID=2632575 RepID=UPI002AD217AD|nr:MULTISPECIES: hypothetical protein [unclassified Frankia]
MSNAGGVIALGVLAVGTTASAVGAAKVARLVFRKAKIGKLVGGFITAVVEGATEPRGFGPALARDLEKINKLTQERLSREAAAAARERRERQEFFSVPSPEYTTSGYPQNDPSWTQEEARRLQERRDEERRAEERRDEQRAQDRRDEERRDEQRAQDRRDEERRAEW